MSADAFDDDDLPAEKRIAHFELRVPASLTWERVAEIACATDTRVSVQARGAGWSDAVPLVLLEFDDSGLQLAMGRRLEGDTLLVRGSADWVDIGAAAETEAEQLCVALLKAICEQAGARIVSAHFTSGAAIR